MPLNAAAPSRLLHAKLSGSEADLTLKGAVTSVPTGERWTALTITVVNNDTADRTVLLRFVPSGETPGDEHNILSNQTATKIKAGQTVVMNGRWTWDAGDKVRGACSSANKVTVRIDGIQATVS